MSGQGRSTGTPRRLGGASARSIRRVLAGDSATGSRVRTGEDQTVAQPANQAQPRVGETRDSRDGTATDESSPPRSSVDAGSGRGERDATEADRVTDPAALDDIDPTDLAALHDRREFLLRSLADLEREHDAGDLADDDYVTLRDDYTARAAEILRAIDERRIVDEDSPRIRRPLRLLAIVAVVVIAAVGAGWFVARSSGTRQAGQTITGDLRNGAQSGSGTQAGATGGAPSGSGSGASATLSPALQRCINQTVAVGRPLLQGQAALDAAGVRKATAAGACYRSILKAHPKDAGALAYRAWNTALLLRGSPGLPTNLQQQLADATQRDLAAAEAANPKLPDAYAFGAISGLWQSRCADARSQLARLDALHLPSTNQIVQLVSTLRPQVTPKACGS